MTENYTNIWGKNNLSWIERESKTQTIILICAAINRLPDKTLSVT